MTTPQPQYAAPAPRPGSGFTVKAADGIVALGGLLVFVFSFAPLWSVGSGGFSASENSWHMGTSVFTALSGLLLLGSAFLDGIWQREAPRYGLHRHVVQVGVALYAFFNTLGFIFGFEGAGAGWGIWLQFVGAIVAAAGAILNHLGRLQNGLAMPQGGGGSAYPPQGYPQGGYQPPAQGFQGSGAPSDPQAPTQAG